MSHRENPKITHIRLSYINPKTWLEKMKTNIPPYQPWLFVDAVVVLRIQHEIPIHLEKCLPKFNPDKKNLVENHVNKFLPTIRL